MKRIDYETIIRIIPKKSKVLDLGCGGGKLLHHLKQSKDIVGSGIEISEIGASEAISKGLSVIQGNLEEVVKNYPDNSFDYVILSQTLQELKHPDLVFHHMLRIGKKCILTFINLAHIKYRLQILFTGMFPRSDDLPFDWKTTNIAFLSVKNFKEYCMKNNIKIRNEIYFTGQKKVVFWRNFRSKLCIYEISR